MESIIMPVMSWVSETAVGSTVTSMGGEVASLAAAEAGSSVSTAVPGLFGAGGSFGWSQALSTLGTIATVGGGVMQADSQMRQSQAQEQALRLAAQQSANNAAMAEQEAKYQEDKTDLSVKQHRLEVSSLKGQQRSLLAESGVDLTTEDGSPLSLLTSTMAMGKYDEDILRYNGDLSAWRYRTQAQQERDASTYKSWQADQAGSSSLLQPAGTLLATAGRVWGRKTGSSLGV